MLNRIVRGCLCFIGGGIFGGFIVGRKVTDDLKDRMDSLEMQNQRLVDEIVKLKEAAKEAKVEEITAHGQVADKLLTRKAEREKKREEEKKDKEEYKAIVKHYIPADEDEEEFRSSDERIAKIKMIDESTFNNNSNYSDVEHLIYYQADDTLVDSNNEIIPREEEVVGAEIMDVICDTTNDWLYAMDEELNKMYDISIEHDLGYLKDVLGIGG